MGEVSIATLLLEGLGLGVMLILICAFGIRNGAVRMLQLYHKEVQDRCVELGLTTHEKIKRNSLMLKLCCLPMYIVYVMVCVYILNGEWRKRIRAGVCTAVRHPVHPESDRPLFHRRMVGRSHKGVDDSRHGGLKTLHHDHLIKYPDKAGTGKKA